ncbi:MAG: TIGR02281 family clan AA aspartic protease [Gammaproteobacteria bacterium]|nr:TIGR02281 family clan AA aspartic protease [Gammaproteobacteria bacterium]
MFIKSALLFFFLTLSAHAAETVHVVGLFPGKVVLMIDGQQVIVKQGNEKQGVKYIKPAGDNVVLEINGKQSNYKMGSSVSLNFIKPDVTRKTIYADDRGMFNTTGSINGHTIQFLVDTGATTIAMSSIEAKRLNIRYRLEGKETTARTASGIARAYLVKLKSVKIGTIEQRNVQGLVIAGAFPQQVLLGMSFLNRLKVEKTGNVMMLESR